jgi:hypothetical protein
MLNWVLTGDTYTTVDDWAHESKPVNSFLELDEEEDPNPLHDETGCRGSSDIDPNELQEEEEENQFELPNLPNLESLDVPDVSQYDTPDNSIQDNSFGQPEHHSTPTSTGARPKESICPEPPPLYRAFGPEDLYQAQLQQNHNNYQAEFQLAKDLKTAKKLRVQLFQQLKDANVKPVLKSSENILIFYSYPHNNFSKLSVLHTNPFFPNRSKRKVSSLERNNHI